MVLLNTKVTKNTENQKIKKQPPLPFGGWGAVSFQWKRVADLCRFELL
jgi:hypothetical protein